MAVSKHCRHPRSKWSRCACAWYWDGRIDGRRTYRNLGTSDRGEARRLAAQIEADRLGGRAVPTRKGAALSDVAERWLEHLTAHGRRPQTIRAYRTAANAVILYFGDVADVRRIDSSEVEKFETVIWREREGNGPRAVLAGLRGILKQAKRDKLIDVVPQGSGERREVAPNPNVRMTEAETEKTIAQLRAPTKTGRPRPQHWGDLADLVVLTGLRISEALALRWEDYDDERGLLSVEVNAEQRGRLDAPPKTRTSKRTFRIDPAAAELLTGIERRAPRIFPYRYAAAYRAINRAMDAAGTNADQRGWHSLRHTNTALRGRAGQSIRDAAAELGHGANFSMTHSYGWADETAEATKVSEVRQRGASESS